jgi:hypothetical protein
VTGFYDGDLLKTKGLKKKNPTRLSGFWANVGY